MKDKFLIRGNKPNFHQDAIIYSVVELMLGCFKNQDNI